MDADDKHCGTCKHGKLHDLCGACEDEYEASRKKKNEWSFEACGLTVLACTCYDHEDEDF